MHIERQDAGREVALLVGMAGKSHWSASVEIDASQPRVLFDVACRVRTGEPGPLLSSYREILPPPAVPLAIELGHRFGPAVIEQDGETRVRIRAQVDSEACPQTVRWDYRVRLVDAPGG